MTLFEECIEVLGNDTKIFSEIETQNLCIKFMEIFPIKYILKKYPIGVDWDNIKVKQNLNGDISKAYDYLSNLYKELNTEVIVMWDIADRPAIKTDLKKVITYVDDVTAVAFDTWIISFEYGYVIEIHHDGIIMAGSISL